MPGDADRPTGWGGDPVELPSPEAIRRADGGIKGHVVRTPLIPCQGTEGIYLKPEMLQPSGAYKSRGVLHWAMRLTEEERSHGLSTHSSGNTALALGSVAQQLHTTARSIVPDQVPPYKIQAMERVGVTPVPLPMAQLLHYVFEEEWKQEPYSFLNPWADPDMLAGNGTIGLEIFQDLPEVQTVIVPVGGGGLALGIGGALKALKPSVRILGAQSAACPALYRSFENGKPVWIEPQPSLCDGTALPLAVDELYPALRSVLDEVVLVGDEEVARAIQFVVGRHHLVVEGSGAMSLAVAMAMPFAERGETVCVLSGGNISTEKLTSLLSSK